MNETEFDDLARLWAQDPDPSEIRHVERLARRASRRARLIQYADIGGGIAIAGGVAVLMLREGVRTTGISGLLLFAGLAWMTWKRNILWEAELDPAADRETFVNASARSAKARLRRTNIGAVSVLPLALLGLWFGHRYRHPEIDSLGDALAAALGRPVETSLLVAALAGLQLYALVARRRAASEVRSLEELAVHYRNERLLDSGSGSAE
jgi:hypothetical protein